MSMKKNEPYSVLFITWFSIRTFIESHGFHSLQQEMTYSWIVQLPLGMHTLTKC